MNKKLLTIPAIMLAALVVSAGVSTKVSAEDNNGLHLGVGVNANTSLQVRGDQNENDQNENGGKGEDNKGLGMMGKAMMMGDMRSGVFGTVTAVNGTTITVQTKTWTKGSTTSTATTYTVNAAGAVVDKNRVASTVSAIAVGDNVMVQGSITGTTVVATSIHDGVMMKMPNTPKTGSQTPQGNGQPVVGGTVSAVNGNTITITNNSNASYVIDVTNAKITKGGTVATAANIAVGDNVLAQGTINGTNVTAVTLIDGLKGEGDNGNHLGFFKSIGNFFSHLFGKN